MNTFNRLTNLTNLSKASLLELKETQDIQLSIMEEQSPNSIEHHFLAGQSQMLEEFLTLFDTIEPEKYWLVSITRSYGDSNKPPTMTSRSFKEEDDARTFMNKRVETYEGRKYLSDKAENSVELYLTSNQKTIIIDITEEKIQ